MFGLVNIEKLKAHENIIPQRLDSIISEIKSYGIIRQPIIVDSRTYTILDGHHRYNAAKKLGLRRIPDDFVEYSDPSIKVLARRSIEVSKGDVIKMSKSGKLFPAKTTRHVLPFGIEDVNILLKRLE